MKPTRPASVWTEIAWRWCFLIFAIAVLVGVAAVTLDSVRLRPNEVASFRSRNPVWMVMAVVALFERSRPLLGGMLWVVATVLAAFWVVVRAILESRRFGRLAVLRAVSLAAGAAAVLSVVGIVVAVSRSHLPAAPASGLVSLFSLAVYACWRWVSLLLAVLESAPDFRQGWANFVASGPWLALAAASNSTLKWLAQAAVTLPAMLALLMIPRQHISLAWWVAGGWLLALASISGYFGARLKDRIHQTWISQSLNLPGFEDPGSWHTEMLKRKD